MLHRLSWSIAACLSVALAAPGQEQNNEQRPSAISFGVYSFKKPTAVYKSFRPAIQCLQRAITAEFGNPVVISLRVFKTYEECLEAFVRGEIDFVRFGPASYVLAKQRNPKIELLAVEQEDGQKVCKGVIAVGTRSDIKTLADLKGKRFAFGDPQSTIGRYLSQAELVKADIHAGDLEAFKYLDRHDTVFKAVEHGDFDAGALHINTFEELNRKNHELRVLWMFDNVGKPWIARAGLDHDVADALRKSLLHLTDERALAALEVSGFLPASDKDYQPVRDGMLLSEQFTGSPAVPAPPPAPAKGQ